MEPDAPQPGDDEVERVVASYVDRLLAGETIAEEEVRSAHPDLASEILVELETFRDLGGALAPGKRPERLGDHEIVREIARGGMGVVYEAVETSLQRRVALKVLPAQFLEDARSIARFIREARIAARLRHPNIVSVYGMGVEKSSPYYSMEYVEG